MSWQMVAIVWSVIIGVPLWVYVAKLPDRSKDK